VRAAAIAEWDIGEGLVVEIHTADLLRVILPELQAAYTEGLEDAQ
jgi:hypothetical protein